MEKGWCFQANVDRWIGYVHDKKTGIDWKWQAMDWCYYKSTSWVKKAQDQIPKTESKSGTKRSILVDGKGYHLVYV